jgi:hypothetical protein
MGEKKRTIFTDASGGEWCFMRRLPAEWPGEKRAAFAALIDGTLDSEETEATREGDDWIVESWGHHLRLTKTSRTFLDEGW